VAWSDPSSYRLPVAVSLVVESATLEWVACFNHRRQVERTSPYVP
jgi:hypothetical protein